MEAKRSETAIVCTIGKTVGVLLMATGIAFPTGGFQNLSLWLIGPKAAHRVLAHGHGRRNPGRLHVAAAGLSRSARKVEQAVRRPLGFSRMAVDDPRWR
jgi:hypothetical protein